MLKMDNKNIFYCRPSGKYVLGLFFVHAIMTIGVGLGRLNAQEILSAEDAVRIGIAQNFSIKILRNQEVLAGNNNTPGNAGMLPTVSTVGTASYAVNNTEQKFFNGETRGGKGASNIGFRTGLEVNWTAFDGFRMFVEQDRLQALESQSRTQTVAQMQDLAARILEAYYNLVQLELSTDNLRYAVSLDRDLLQLVENKKRIGTATGLELLQSRSRFTADSARLVQLETDIQRARKNFNQLLNRPVDEGFQVDSMLSSILLPSLDELLERGRQANPSLLLSRIERALTSLATSGLRSNLWPELSFQGTLNYNFQRNDIGFLLSNRNFGPTIGLTLRYNIYDGNNRTRNIANARIAEENAALREAELQQIVEAQIRTRYGDYQALRQLAELEALNLKVAEEQATLARELYRLGRTTNFEVREAILQGIQANDRVIQNLFQLKQIEISLLNLAGIPLYAQDN
jgi:outer membrane protein TolC